MVRFFSLQRPITLMSTFSAVPPENDDIKCAVCLMPWTDPVELLPCKHLFCRACVRALRKRECPECRTAIQSEGLPNRILINMAAAATVKCDACSWQGRNDAARTHPCPSAVLPGAVSTPMRPRAQTTVAAPPMGRFAPPGAPTFVPPPPLTGSVTPFPYAPQPQFQPTYQATYPPATNAGSYQASYVQAPAQPQQLYPSMTASFAPAQMYGATYVPPPPVGGVPNVAGANGPAVGKYRMPCFVPYGPR